MERTDDIYKEVDSIIVENGFWDKDLEGKKNLVEQALIEYTKNKFFKNCDDQKQHSEEQSELIYLLKQIDSKLEMLDEKEEIFRHYTHYLLNIVSCIQDYSITWWDDDNVLVDEPVLKIEDEEWQNLSTNSETLPLNITMFVFDIFKTNYIKEERHVLKREFIKLSF